MCGIAGFSGNFSEPLLTAMHEAIAYRGPDAFGIWYDPENKIGLTHRRLSIIDLSQAAAQPMWDATRTVAIVFNGEIYNFLSLRKILENEGYQFNSHSDTEVLLNLYLLKGYRMLDSLDGIFAFCIYDTRDSSLFLARDHFGTKPLYYSEAQKGFIFASELKSIIKESSIPKEINPKALHYHLNYLWSPAPETMLKSVKKLEPGSALVVKHGKIVNRWQYYELPYKNPIANLSEADAKEQLLALLESAVTKQMISDVPVGSFLSGGLDSSAIVTFASKINKNLPCFTMDFIDNIKKSEGITNDLPYAKEVAKFLGLPLHSIETRGDLLHELKDMIYHLEEPTADPAALNTYKIARLARSQGIKVLLSGAGGDDIFSGYTRHYALGLGNYFNFLPQSCLNFLANMAKYVPSGKRFGRRLAKLLSHISMSENQRIVSYYHWIEPSLIGQLYSPDYLSKNSNLFNEPLLGILDAMPKDTKALNKMLFIDGKYFLGDHNLNYTDKMSMAAGVEVRVPFLDKELVDFAYRLPASFKQHGKTGKWIFKRAMEQYLPKSIIYRPKTGFSSPLRHWIRYEMQPVIQEYLSPQSIDKRGIFSKTKVLELINNNHQGRIDASYTIFTLLCIEEWCRLFLD